MAFAVFSALVTAIAMAQSMILLSAMRSIDTARGCVLFGDQAPIYVNILVPYVFLPTIGVWLALGVAVLWQARAAHKRNPADRFQPALVLCTAVVQAVLLLSQFPAFGAMAIGSMILVSFWALFLPHVLNVLPFLLPPESEPTQSDPTTLTLSARGVRFVRWACCATNGTSAALWYIMTRLGQTVCPTAEADPVNAMRLLTVQYCEALAIYYLFTTTRITLKKFRYPTKNAMADTQLPLRMPGAPDAIAL